ncbi:hypothetical protein B0H63DRAFT_440942 [Podospora didyma]|uniref:Rhodopsin domain-containing protein n=1 Tax=Podospora didyma TaxID=330526 RepID=A0AAE0K717_9PEZI|nr:hypothetical protein B0H63DRAFT_440942 [Podospora didyma]
MEEGPLVVPISDRAAFLARVHVGVTIPLLALCLLPFVWRLYIRIWPVWRFGWDDALMALGVALAMTNWALMFPEIYMTPQFISIPAAIHAIKFAYLAIPVWALSMTCIKVSVAITLLRLPLDRCWIISLRIIVVVLVAWFIGDTIYVFVKCRPLAASWDFTIVEKQCADIHTDVLVSNIATGLNILTDVLLSLAPMITLWNVRRPLRERVLVCALTGMGLFASLASVLKAVILIAWGNAEDPWAVAMSLASYTVAEQYLAILAACSPSLKGPIQRLLGRFGILLTRYESNISFVHLSRRGKGNRLPCRRRDEEEAIGGDHPGSVKQTNEKRDGPGSSSSKSPSEASSSSTLGKGSEGGAATHVT